LDWHGICSVLSSTTDRDLASRGADRWTNHPRAIDHTVATKQLEALRHRYKAAYTAYLTCVQQLSEASKRGEWPPTQVLMSEENALNDLTLSRQALLEALKEHVTRGPPL
jgi:hypothetical protein